MKKCRNCHLLCDSDWTSYRLLSLIEQCYHAMLQALSASKVKTISSLHKIIYSMPNKAIISLDSRDYFFEPLVCPSLKLSSIEFFWNNLTERQFKSKQFIKSILVRHITLYISWILFELRKPIWDRICDVSRYTVYYMQYI